MHVYTVYVVALSDWLPALGFTYKNLVPQTASDNEGTAARTRCDDVLRGAVMRSQRTDRLWWSEQFRAVETTPSVLARNVHTDDDILPVSVRPYVFSGGVIIRPVTSSQSSCQRVVVHLLDNADVALSRLAVLLLNNSLFLTTYLSVTDRRQVHHYIKPSSSALRARLDDVTAHWNSSSDLIKYYGDVSLTVSHLSSHDDVDVSVMNDVAVLYVRHVRRSHVDLMAERRRVDASNDTVS